MTTHDLLSLPAYADDWQRALIAAFPAEDIAIRVYFKDVACAAAGAAVSAAAALPAWMRGEERAGDYLARNFRDPSLRTLLARRGAEGGVPADDTPFSRHAQVVQRTLQGGNVTRTLAA